VFARLFEDGRICLSDNAAGRGAPHDLGGGMFAPGSVTIRRDHPNVSVELEDENVDAFLRLIKTFRDAIKKRYRRYEDLNGLAVPDECCGDVIVVTPLPTRFELRRIPRWSHFRGQMWTATMTVIRMNDDRVHSATLGSEQRNSLSAMEILHGRGNDQWCSARPDR
jgi:hypothetical protein